MIGTTVRATVHKTQLQDYFDGVGFERWAAIYGKAPLSRVRRSIREGHTRMLARAEEWLCADHAAPGSLLDAGCGTGLFSIAVARRGFQVTAVDIAPRMVTTAEEAANQAGVGERIRFLQGDIESVAGDFDAVACFDVLVHYPQEAFVPLCTHLAQRSKNTLLLTYAPHSHLLAAMHWIGGFFPKGHRRTEIQMIREAVVVDTLRKAGLHVRRSATISHGFYHVRLIQASRSEADDPVKS
jgi:magnesium-protoporphyrin O-methyltransferase